MIFIVDRFVEEHSHVLANVNTVKILNLIFPNQSKIFIAEELHSKLVQNYFEKEEYNKIEFQNYKNSKFATNNIFVQFFRVFCRTFNDIVFFLNLFRSLKNNIDSIVFLTHIYPVSLPFVLICKKFYPKTKLIITIHGEIEYLFYGKSRYEKLIGKIYDCAFNIKAKNVCYLFLTKISKKILMDSGKLKNNEIITIILPTLLNNDAFLDQSQLNYPIRIGHIGSAGKRKNVDLLFEIGADLKDEIKNRNLILSAIGPIEENLKSYINDYVVNFVNGKVNVHLERETFNNEIKKIHYSVFFYGPNDFVLRSGAAFFDAIYYQKPLIVLRNAFFEGIFEEAGNIGYICNSKDEMIFLIQKIISNDPTIKDDYQMQLYNIQQYKKTLDLKHIANDMTEQINEIGFAII